MNIATTNVSQFRYLEVSLFSFVIDAPGKPGKYNSKKGRYPYGTIDNISTRGALSVANVYILDRPITL